MFPSFEIPMVVLYLSYKTLLLKLTPGYCHKKKLSYPKNKYLLKEPLESNYPERASLDRAGDVDIE